MFACSLKIFFAFFFLFGLPVFAQESETPPAPQIVIELGKGRVDVQSQGMELSASTLERLQTELMVNDQLSTAVTSDEPTKIVLSGPELERLQTYLSQQAEQTAQQIQSLVTLQMQGPGGHSPVPWSEGNTIIMNENVTVGPHEYRAELIVIGGHVFVQGDVGVLVVLGGDVVVMQGGRVITETVVLGGKLQVKPGGQISPQQTVLSTWDMLPWLRRHVLVWWDQAWAVAFLSVMGWLWAWAAVALLQKSFTRFWVAAESCWRNHKFVSFLWGIGFMLAWVPAVGLLTVSVVGLILVPLLVGLLFLWILVAYALLLKFMAQAVGQVRDLSLPLQLFLAQLVWLLIGLIPVGGILIRMVLITMAMGAVALAASPLRLTPRRLESTNEG